MVKIFFFFFFTFFQLLSHFSIFLIVKSTQSKHINIKEKNLPLDLIVNFFMCMNINKQSTKRFFLIIINKS